jgi:aerobic-type carbon monoxide dehydrogenase small subunit (CoxS/CutS family)
MMTLKVNGRDHQIDAEPDTPLLYVLRDDLLQRNPKANDEQIRAELAPHLCRCGTHMRILRAVHRARRLMDTADLISDSQGSAQ